MDHLKKLYKKEKDPKAKERLLAYMARKRGDSLRTIGKNFCKSFSVIRVWLYRVIDGDWTTSTTSRGPDLRAD